MPGPPSEPDKADLKELLKYLVQVVQEECSTAATRHEGVLTRLSGQEKALSQVLIAFNRDSIGIQQVVQEECSSAATRHEDVLTRLSEQAKAFNDAFFGVSQSPQLRAISESVPVNASPPLENSEPLEIVPVNASETVVENATPPLENIEPLETIECSEPLLDSEGFPIEPENIEPPAVKKEVECEVQEPAEAPTPTAKPPLQKMLSSKSKLKFGQDQKHATEEEKQDRVLVRIVTHDNFEAMVAAVILSSGIVMCFEVQYRSLQVCHDLRYRGCQEEAHAIWPAAWYAFVFFDWFFGMVFLAEAILKLGCYGMRYFKDVWNWLDLIVVVTFVIDKGASSFLPINKQILALLRLFRLVRLFRLLETLEGLDALYIMTTAIKGMKKVLMWAVVLLLVMLTTESLFMVQFLHGYYFVVGNTWADPEKQKKLYEYFGSYTRCLLSMFELTLANWPPVTRLLAEEVTEWFMLICVIHKLTIGFAVVGVINGVIMQETFQVAATDDMLMVRKKQKQADLMKMKMIQLFEALDHSDDASLGYEEFQIISHVPEVKSWLASMDIETDDLPTLFELIDHDGNGTIPIEELTSRIPRIKGAARSIDVLALAKHMTEGNFAPRDTKARQEAAAADHELLLSLTHNVEAAAAAN